VSGSGGIPFNFGEDLGNEAEALLLMKAFSL
jgi:hypothetical protein